MRHVIRAGIVNTAVSAELQGLELVRPSIMRAIMPYQHNKITEASRRIGEGSKVLDLSCSPYAPQLPIVALGDFIFNTVRYNENNIEALYLQSNGATDSLSLSIVQLIQETNLNTLNLLGNNFSSEGVCHILDALIREERFVKEIKIGKMTTELSSQELDKLIILIEKNQIESLCVLSRITAEGLLKLSSALQKNTSLKSLDVYYQTTSPDALKAFMCALQSHRSLQYIDLSSNLILEDAAKEVLNMLRHNQSLISIRLMLPYSSKVELNKIVSNNQIMYTLLCSISDETSAKLESKITHLKKVYNNIRDNVTTDLLNATCLLKNLSAIEYMLKRKNEFDEREFKSVVEKATLISSSLASAPVLCDHCDALDRYKASVSMPKDAIETPTVTHQEARYETKGDVKASDIAR